MTLPLISIVVITRNRADLLRGALASLQELKTRDAFRYEIVVVDNGSTDHTALVAAELREHCSVPVRYVFEAKPGIAVARNRGVRESLGEWIAFFDDDQLADADWLHELWSFATQRDLLAVGGAVLLKFVGGPERKLHSFTAMLLGQAMWSSKPFPYSSRISFGCGNLMLQRSVFDRVGLFNEACNLRAEDTELFHRLRVAGIASWYVPTARVHHLTPPERLAESYLARLSERMGRDIARRESERHSAPLFALRLLGKGLRYALWHSPRHLLAKQVGDVETSLGLHCVGVLSRNYLHEGLALLGRRCQNALNLSLGTPAPRPLENR